MNRFSFLIILMGFFTSCTTHSFSDGSISVNGMKLPRMRHWYTNDGDTYLGSDIIVKELKE